MQFKLKDNAGGENPRTVGVNIEFTNGFLCIAPDGYGEYDAADGHGQPILLEVWEGQLRVILFSDINNQDPQIIVMEGAREDKRKPEEQADAGQERELRSPAGA